jgi:hypothetical protein
VAPGVPEAGWTPRVTRRRQEISAAHGTPWYHSLGGNGIFGELRLTIAVRRPGYTWETVREFSLCPPSRPLFTAIALLALSRIIGASRCRTLLHNSIVIHLILKPVCNPKHDTS